MQDNTFGRKLFLGGLSANTTKESLQAHFEQYGGVQDTTLALDRFTGRSRCFGFVTMKDTTSMPKILGQQQIIDGKRVDCKEAVPKDNAGAAAPAATSDDFRTRKMFVGGLPQDITTDEFKEFFAQFGALEDANVMFDKDSGRPRGFGFVTYQDEDSVEAVLKSYDTNQIRGKWIECKKAQTREPNTNRGYEHPGPFPYWQGMGMPEGYPMPGMMPQMMQPLPQMQRQFSGSGISPEEADAARKQDEIIKAKLLDELLGEDEPDAQKKEQYRREIQQQMADREARREQEKQSRLLAEKKEEERINEQQKQLYDEYLREAGKVKQPEPVQTKPPTPPSENVENRQPSPPNVMPTQQFQYPKMQPANFAPRPIQPPYPQPITFPDRTELNKLRAEMKQQYESLNHLIKDIKNESAVASQQRADAQMELERIKQELNLSVYENQLRNQELMMAMNQMQYGQIAQPAPPQYYQTAANPGYYDTRNSSTYSSMQNMSIQSQYTPQPQQRYAPQQHNNLNSNTEERNLTGESEFIPVSARDYDLAAGNAETNPTYSYIDNPDIKAELNKLDYLLNVHLKNEPPSRQQRFDDTLNDRDPEQLVYQEREAEFDSDKAWTTFDRPDSAEDNDIKLKTVTELQEFIEESDEENQYGAGEYEAETGQYIDEMGDVPEDIHREVEEEYQKAYFKMFENIFFSFA